MKAEYKFGKNSGQTIFSVWFEMKVGIRKDKKLYFWLWEMLTILDQHCLQTFLEIILSVCIQS